MLFIKLSWASESLKTQERLLSQAVSECHLATGVLNVFSQFNHFEWVWVTIRVNASSLSLSLFAVEVTSFVAGWLWRSFNGCLALYLAVWNMFYIHKEVPECARIMSSLWWIFHALCRVPLWQKIGLHSYPAQPFRGTINYRNHCVFSHGWQSLNPSVPAKQWEKTSWKVQETHQNSWGRSFVTSWIYL